ncbi:MAG: methyltransferase domain-containing protein, partial [Anaerolineae bacterium]|nr:methyltransferase domain-containing protein [Anaerolineae bacterium]
MTKIVNDNVAEYYGRKSQSYIDIVRDNSAYRREISRRELAFVLKHLKPNARVLEIGCGPGFFTQELVKRAKSVMATDISENMVNALQENVLASNLSTMSVDVYDLDKVPHYGEYDTVVCMRVLCHVDDAGRGLSKLRGAIHPQGNVIFDL